MALPRLICQFLTRWRVGDAPLLPSAAPRAASQAECCCTNSSSPEADDDACLCRKECWREHNDLSVSTRASSYSDQAQSLRSLALGSLASDSEGETEDTVPLGSTLFFYGPASEDEAGSAAPLVRAEHVQCDKDGAVTAVVGTDRRRSAVVSASPESLLVDCRIQAEDDPQLVSMLGAHLRAGRVKRLRVERVAASSEHDTNEEGVQVVCLCEAPILMELGHAPNPVVLGAAVEELKEQQVKRDNAKLLAYQREINARLLGAQRRRFLGIADPQASSMTH